MKDIKAWIHFMCEVCEKIQDKDDRELVRKRLTKKTEMFFKILKAEVKEDILHKLKK
jgi:uncharacterized protein YlaI